MIEQTVLGFDYGRKRIGVAVGQTIIHTASPLTIVHAHKNKPNWPIITQLIKSWRPNIILVGLPVDMDGNQHQTTALAKRFIRQLLSRYRLPVEAVDERLSSFEARRRCLQKNKAVDAIAAQLIIEVWFSEQMCRHGQDIIKVNCYEQNTRY